LPEIGPTVREDLQVVLASRNEKDHAVLKRAIHDGKVKAVIEKAK
jgi:hypothetical protein